MKDDFRASILAAWTSVDPISRKELRVLTILCTALDPFIPAKDLRSHIAFQLPLVLIANTVQRVIGVGQHARRICPHVSPAKIHSFHLDAAAIYEIMASSANKDNFVILNNMWAPITSLNWAVDDKATTFAAFLDLGRIFKICEERTMEFTYHVTVNADDTVDLLGELLPSQEPKSSFLTKRRKFRKELQPATKHKPTAAEQQTVVGLDAYIKRLDQQLRKRYAEKRELDDDISSLVKEPETHIGRLKEQRYYTLKELRWRRCDLWSKINMLKNRIKQRKSQKYIILYPKVKEKPCIIICSTVYLMRCIQAKNETPLPTAPPPTFANPGHEDASEFINLKPFCQAAREAKTDIIFSGTDYGVRTMSTTVAMTMDRFEQHWNLYNRFSALSIEEVEDVGDADENGLLSRLHVEGEVIAH